jgi:hypothetical protein
VATKVVSERVPPTRIPMAAEADIGPYGLPVSWVTTALVTSFSMAVTELGGVFLSRKYGAEQKDFTLKNLVVVGCISLFQVCSLRFSKCKADACFLPAFDQDCRPKGGS